MALAAAGGWVLGNDELLGRAGARGENPSASAAPDSPVQPTAVPTQPPSDAVVVAAPTPTPSLPAIRELTITPSPAPIPTATVRPSPTPIPPTATPLPPTPTPTYIPPHLRHLEHKEYMLELINAERVRNRGGLLLGVNDAAQIKAESAVENCAGSHWSLDGLKPYMRYSLAGWLGSPMGKTDSGLHYCYYGSRLGAGRLRRDHGNLRTNARG